MGQDRHRIATAAPEIVVINFISPSENAAAKTFGDCELEHPGY